MAAPAEMDEAEANRRMSEMQLKEASENKELAELDYKRAAEVVERMTIRSPVDGVVVERFMSPGEYVEKDPIVKVAQINPLNVEVIIPAAQLLSIKVGMRATVIPEPPVSGRFPAVVTVVDKVVDVASGTFGVRLEFRIPTTVCPPASSHESFFQGSEARGSLFFHGRFHNNRRSSTHGFFYAGYRYLVIVVGSDIAEAGIGVGGDGVAHFDADRESGRVALVCELHVLFALPHHDLAVLCLLGRLSQCNEPLFDVQGYCLPETALLPSATARFA